MNDFSSHSRISRFSARSREWRGVLRARRRLAFCLFVCVVATGTLVTLQTPPVYEASMKILVAPGQPADAPPAAVSDEEFNTEAAILGSREVLAATTGRVQLAPLMDSRVISVSVRERSPEQAARDLNALFQKYVAQRQQLNPQAAALDALRTRAADFQRRLAEATAALSRFDAESGLSSVSLQQELLLRQFYDLQSQANAARTEQQALRERISALRAQLAVQPERIETSSVTKYVQALDKLKGELAALEMQRTQMLQKYQPDHRLIRDLDLRIAQAREIIAREEQNPPRERSVALNETHRRLTGELLEAEAALAATTSREQQLGELARRCQQRLTDLDQHGYRKNDLERERAISEESWLLYQRRAQETELNRTLRQGERVRVSLLEAVAVSSAPVSPRWAIRLPVLFLGGLLLALAGVGLAELRRPRIRSGEGVSQRLKLPVLARIPGAHRAA